MHQQLLEQLNTAAQNRWASYPALDQRNRKAAQRKQRPKTKAAITRKAKRQAQRTARRANR